MTLIDVLCIAFGLGGFAAIAGAAYFAEDCQIREAELGLGGAL